MTFRRTVTLGLALIVLLAVGCKPKPPAPPAADLDADRTEVPDAPPTTDVAPGPRPSDEGDIQETPLDGDLAAANEYAYSQGLLGNVYFAFDQSTLDDRAKARLQQNAQFLKDRSEFIVTVEGHCDERGTNEYNIALGERRGNAALDYLVELGIPASRFRTISYGEERPDCTDSSESCWAKNRRAHFKLTGRSS